MKSQILKDILDVFEVHQAYDNQHIVVPKDFKDLSYSTKNIVTMLGHLIENRIVICDENKMMYFNKNAWNVYCKKAKQKTFLVIFIGILFGIIMMSLV